MPCHVRGVSCGAVCAAPLPCGLHKCKQVCHAGPCKMDYKTGVVPKPALASAGTEADDAWGSDPEEPPDAWDAEDGTSPPVEATPSCGQPCGRRRPCGHPCVAACHPGKPCPTLVCRAEVAARCRCGRRTARTACKFGDAAEMGRLRYAQMHASDGQGIRQQPTRDGASAPTGRRLACDQRCAMLQKAAEQESRNREFASALGLENVSLTGGLSEEYSEFLLAHGARSRDLLARVERDLKAMVSTAGRRRHAFPAMKSDDRQLVHEYAAHFDLDTISYDPEPKRNVVAFRNNLAPPRLPQPLLSEVLGSRRPAARPAWGR